MGKAGEYPKLIDFLMKNFKFDPKTTGLIIIDMDKGTCHPKGYLARLGAEVSVLTKPVPKIKKLLNFFRMKSLKVFYTTGSSGEELKGKFSVLDELKTLERMNLRSFPRIKEGFEKGYLGPNGKYGNSIIDELKPKKGEEIIRKTTSGAFNSSDIDYVLKRERIETLIITGVATNLCAGLTAMDAADRGYNCVLVSDATATFYEKWHKFALETFDFRFGKVMTTDEVIEELKDVFSE